MKVVATDSFFDSLTRLRRRWFHDSWYWFKCRVWHQHNVVRIKSLPPTWSDRVTILPHAMFQVLVDFIDQECSPGHVDWDATDHHKAARAEMQDHYDWWKNVYLKFDAWHDFDYSKSTKFDDMFIPSEDGEFYTMAEPSDYEKGMYETIRQREKDMDAELTRRMIRLVELRDYYWT